MTTIGGTPDIHIYDVARIESLAGPQGMLYGASSEAGTIRIITNKPDVSSFYGRVDAEANTVKSGGQGGRIEGMLNIPLSTQAALRVVGFYQHDAGYIDNVPGTRSFTGGITANNAAFVEKNYNDSDIWGGRAALKIDLDDNWTVTPTVLYQEQRNHGSFGYDPKVGDLQVQHFFPEYRRDRYVQAGADDPGQGRQLGRDPMPAPISTGATPSPPIIPIMPRRMIRLYSSVGGNRGLFLFPEQRRAANRFASAHHRHRPFQEDQPGTARCLAAGRALSRRRWRLLPAAKQRDPPGLSGGGPGRYVVGQRAPGNALAYRAASR